MPDLSIFILITGLSLLIVGVGFIMNRPGWQKALTAFPRSESAAFVTMGVGGLWFLYKMYYLGPQDELFGPKTNLILVAVFGAGWIGSFFALKEFLAVRGLCVLWLMGAFFALEAGRTHYETPVLIFKAVVYVFVILAIWLGVSPFRMRDGLSWLFKAGGRSRIFGSALALAGAGLSLIALTT